VIKTFIKSQPVETLWVTGEGLKKVE